MSDAAFLAAARIFETAERSRQWLYDPVGWAENVIAWGPGEGLTSYQSEILSAIPLRGRVAVRGPHGLGKTALVAITILWFSITRELAGIDWKVPITASAWRHLSMYAMPEVHKWARKIRWDQIGRPPFKERSELLDLTLKLRYGQAAALASDDPAKIEGAHADSLLYVFDEAKAIPTETWDAAEGAFSGGQTEGLPEAFAIAFSTPGPPAGRFYDIHTRKRGLEDWWVRHVKLDEAIKAGRVSQQWAEQRRIQWGEQSAVYQNRVEGEFHASDEDAVIPLAWIEAAVERWHEWNDAGRPAVDGSRVLGVDVARTGGDSTILAPRLGHVIVGFEEHRLEDTMATTARVQVALAGGTVTPIVDSIGIGAGVVDRLRELGIPVIAYTGAAKTKTRDRSREFGFKNVRSAAYWNLRELLDPAFEPTLCLPPDDMLLADLVTPTWDITTGVPPQIRVESKEDLIKRLGRSPDRGDAVAMAMWADRAGGITTISSPTSVPTTTSSGLGGGSGASLIAQQRIPRRAGPVRAAARGGARGTGRR